MKRAGVTAAAAAAVLMLFGGQASAAITCGQTITKDRKLKADLLDCPGDGLILGAAGITLDLNGHRIDGVGADNSSGIESSGRPSVVVKGPGRITGFDDGVRLGNSSGAKVKRVTIAGLSSLGIFLTDSDNVKVKRNTIKRIDAYGISVAHSANGVIARNTVLGPDDSPAHQRQHHRERPELHGEHHPWEHARRRGGIELRDLDEWHV